MFDQIKQLMQMKNLQTMIAQEKVTVEHKGVHVTVNGKMNLEDVKLNPELPQVDQEKAIVEAFNQAVQKIQSSIAEKMMQQQ